MKYRKKPVVVEATQWHRMGDHPAVFENPVMGADSARVQTAGGYAEVFPGDWIITESDGRGHYPCRPDIFARLYEPDDGGEPAAGSTSDGGRR